MHDYVTMQLRNLNTLITDDDAVSPVIGVVLMVAITVILAAVIGTFVIGLGSETDTVPQASLEFEYSSGSVTIVHDGGDTLDAATLAIEETNTSSDAQVTASGDISAGDLVADSTSVDSGETLRVVYQHPDQDKSAVLATSTAP